MATPAFKSHGAETERSGLTVVDPRDVVAKALDSLGDGYCFVFDDGINFMLGLDRRQAVDIISTATTSMYPHIFDEAAS